MQEICSTGTRTWSFVDAVHEECEAVAEMRRRLSFLPRRRRRRRLQDVAEDGRRHDDDDERRRQPEVQEDLLLDEDVVAEVDVVGIGVDHRHVRARGVDGFWKKCFFYKGSVGNHSSSLH